MRQISIKIFRRKFNLKMSKETRVTKNTKKRQRKAPAASPS